jgi:hypothetical protein
MSQNVPGDVGNWANTLFSWSAPSLPKFFVLRACFALSVSGALTVRQVQALLAPNYRWLDPQQSFQKYRL